MNFRFFEAKRRRFEARKISSSYFSLLSFMSNTIKYYLAAYNFTAFIFWAFYFFSFIASGFELNPQNLFLLNIAQGLAVLEIIHALLKWVKSPVVSTGAQVGSRILVLVLINIFFNNQTFSHITILGVLIVSVAWSVTELVRYSLYFFSLFNKQPSALLWMRYSFFIVLYPLGVTGEWFILITPLVASGFVLNAYNIFLVINFAAYAYYFPVLYRYMWKQRKAKLQ